MLTCADDACGGDGAVIVDLLQHLREPTCNTQCDIACIPMHTDHILHSACLWSLFGASAHAEALAWNWQRQHSHIVQSLPDCFRMNAASLLSKIHTSSQALEMATVGHRQPERA